VEEVFEHEVEDAAALARLANSAINQANFTEADKAICALRQLELTPEMQLFALQSRLRLAELMGRKLEACEAVETIEQAYHGIAQPGGWVQHWYVYAWLILPFACGYPVDIFYLHHLSQELPQVVMRQRCVARAVQHGVQQYDHNFMAFILDGFESRPLQGDPYYRSKVCFLIDIYHRDYSRLRIDADNFKRSASSPLQEHAAAMLIRQYSHLIAKS